MTEELVKVVLIGGKAVHLAQPGVAMALCGTRSEIPLADVESPEAWKDAPLCGRCRRIRDSERSA